MRANVERAGKAKEILTGIKEIILRSNETAFCDLKKREMQEAFDLCYKNGSIYCPVLSDDERKIFSLSDASECNIFAKFEFNISYDRKNIVDIYISGHRGDDSLFYINDDDESRDDIVLIDKALSFIDTFSFARIGLADSGDFIFNNAMLRYKPAHIAEKLDRERAQYIISNYPSIRMMDTQKEIEIEKELGVKAHGEQCNIANFKLDFGEQCLVARKNDKGYDFYLIEGVRI